MLKLDNSTVEIFNTTRQWLPKKALKSAIAAVLYEEQHTPLMISAVYCGDRFIKKINQQYLQHDYATDTISFRLNEGSAVEGEFYISLNTVRRNARRYRQSFIAELLRVTIHSTLHLVGYNDETDSQRSLMTEKEDYYLALLCTTSLKRYAKSITAGMEHVKVK
ncbi:MAG: rRNA maturation RNase YbeY [Chloroherpetonaceae bacterium]|nr:rRNA maturation RNase YbeY [Chloroherpetonaceae bacterium]